MHDLSHLRLKTIEGVDGQKGGSNEINQALRAKTEKMEAKLCCVFLLELWSMKSNSIRKRRAKSLFLI